MEQPITLDPSLPTIAPTPQIQPPPPPPAPKHKPKISLFVVLIILLPVLGLISFMYLQKDKKVVKPLVQLPVTSPISPTEVPPTPFPTTFVTPIPDENPTSQPGSWKTFIHNNYKFTIQYPPEWTLLQGSDRNGNARISIFGAKTSKSISDGRLLPELYITKTSPYNFADMQLCENCKPATNLSATILGQSQSVSVLMAEVIKGNGSERKLDFYTFSVPLPDKSNLYAIASYRTPEDGQMIATILSTLTY